MIIALFSFIASVIHGKDLPRTRRLTTGALQSARVINKSLKEFHALSGSDSSSMISHGIRFKSALNNSGS